VGLPIGVRAVKSGSQPDWYMSVADGLLRVMPGWEVAFRDHTPALDNLIPLATGVGFFLWVSFKRIPNGAFVEVYEPLSQEQLHVLAQHEQYKPITDKHRN
jgi:hypothetical protein